MIDFGGAADEAVHPSIFVEQKYVLMLVYDLQ